MCIVGRVQLKCDGARYRTGREVKGKLANGVGSQYSLHTLGTRCVQHHYHYYRQTRTTRLPVVDWTDAPADLNGLIRLAKRGNLVSALVPSYFKRFRHWLMCTHHIYCFIMCDIGVALCRIYHSFVTTVSQLKICNFSFETFKGFEVLLSVMSATTTQPLSSGEFCKVRYMTLYPLKVHLQTFLSVLITQKC
jgi:hypothetical protein